MPSLMPSLKRALGSVRSALSSTSPLNKDIAAGLHNSAKWTGVDDVSSPALSPPSLYPPAVSPTPVSPPAHSQVVPTFVEERLALSVPEAGTTDEFILNYDVSPSVPRSRRPRQDTKLLWVDETYRMKNPGHKRAAKEKHPLPRPWPEVIKVFTRNDHACAHLPSCSDVPASVDPNLLTVDIQVQPIRTRMIRRLIRTTGRYNYKTSRLPKPRVYKSKSSVWSAP